MIGLAVGVSGANAVADAAERTRLDRGDGVRFRLEGRQLTVKLVPQPRHHPPDARKQLFGKRIRAVCGFEKWGGTVTYRTRRWRRGQLKRTYRLPRDISSVARWCLLENVNAGGGDVAYVKFRSR